MSMGCPGKEGEDVGIFSEKDNIYKDMKALNRRPWVHGSLLGILKAIYMI